MTSSVVKRAAPLRLASSSNLRMLRLFSGVVDLPAMCRENLESVPAKAANGAAILRPPIDEAQGHGLWT